MNNRTALFVSAPSPHLYWIPSSVCSCATLTDTRHPPCGRPCSLASRQGAASGVRVNSVSPGHVETPIYGEMPRETLVAVTGTTQLIARPIKPEEVRHVP